MKHTTISLAVMALLAGCAAATPPWVSNACDLIGTAMDEAQLAEAWHIEAGRVLEACGAPRATERAAHKACHARRFNDNSVVCGSNGEAMP